VAQNVAYPLEIRKVDRQEIDERVNQVLVLVGLADMADKLATQLSGGQQQRAALARAIVSKPRLLLFDEPLSNLDLKLREQIENTIRFLAVDAVNRANSGHPGAPMGLARPAFELWNNHLRFDPSDPQWALRDRFILSNGHGSMLIYSLLHLFGYDLSLDDLIAFRTLGSKTPGHPEYGDTPGIEVTTGPLGQGFGHSVGMALAARMTRSHFGSPAGTSPAGPGHHFVYGIAGDGDLMEGISYESASFAGNLGLGNLIYLFDDNAVTIDGPTSIAFNEDVAGRFEAQRWHVQAVDGEDVQALRRALAVLRRLADAGEAGDTGKRSSLPMSFDLAELRGYRYHTGVVFAALVPGHGEAIARGGRYDDVGRYFGRARPATGFSTDLRTLLRLGDAEATAPHDSGIFAPSGADPALCAAIRDLRAGGERVVRALPGQAGGAAEAGCDRELVRGDRGWEVAPIARP